MFTKPYMHDVGTVSQSLQKMQKARRNCVHHTLPSSERGLQVTDELVKQIQEVERRKVEEEAKKQSKKDEGIRKKEERATLRTAAWNNVKTSCPSGTMGEFSASKLKVNQLKLALEHVTPSSSRSGISKMLKPAVLQELSRALMFGSGAAMSDSSEAADSEHDEDSFPEAARHRDDDDME